MAHPASRTWEQTMRQAVRPELFVLPALYPAWFYPSADQATSSYIDEHLRLYRAGRHAGTEVVLELLAHLRFWHFVKITCANYTNYKVVATLASNLLALSGFTHDAV